MEKTARYHRLTLVAFALIYGALIWLVSSQFPPQSMLWRASELDGEPNFDIQIGDVYEFEWESRGGQLDEIVLKYFFLDDKGELEVTVENATRGTEIARTMLERGHLQRVPIEGEITRGERIRLTYHLIWSQKERFPAMPQALKRAHLPPFMEIEVTINGRKLTPAEVEEGKYWPLFHEKYRTSIDWVKHLWWLPLALLLPLLFRPLCARWTFAWLLVAGLILSGVSLRAWFDRYEHHWTYSDPDDYGKYGAFLHQWLTGNEAQKEDALEWMRNHSHCHIPFTPVIIAGLRFLGASMLCALAWWAAFCSFASVLLLHWFLRCRLNLHWRTCLLAVGLLMYHIIFWRAFGRGSTDPSSVLFAMAGLAFLFERTQRKFTWWQEGLFALFLLANALARPPGLPASMLYLAAAFMMDHLKDCPRRGWELVLLAALLSPFAVWGLLPFLAAAAIGGLVWLILRWKSLEIRILQSFGPVVIHALVFLGIYGALFVGFEWSGSIERNFAKAESFRANSNWKFFHSSFVITVYPLLVALPGCWLIGKMKNHAPWLAALWTVSFMLLLTVFEAPFYNRLFTPAIPGVMVLTAIGMDWAAGRARWAWLPTLLVVALSAASGLILTWMMSMPDWPPEPWARWFFF